MISTRAESLERGHANVQADDEERHGGVLETTVDIKTHVERVVAAATSGPVLGRKDERREPEVRENDIERQQISAV